MKENEHLSEVHQETSFKSPGRSHDRGEFSDDPPASIFRHNGVDASTTRHQSIIATSQRSVPRKQHREYVVLYIHVIPAVRVSADKSQRQFIVSRASLVLIERVWIFMIVVRFANLILRNSISRRYDSI